MRSKWFALAMTMALAACLYLGSHINSSRWTMAADEAVHAIDGLRLYDDLHHGRIGAFVRDTYFSERWQPPVNNHLRWYPFVHSWMQAAAFLVLGPSDFAARLPSVICLFGSCLVFFALAWRLAPERGGFNAARGVSGALAVALLLTAPNVVSFLPNGLIESAVFFMCWLALLAYVWFLEQPDSTRRAVLAGAAIAAAILTKYDHGILVAIAVAIAEAVRAEFRPRRLMRSRAVALFATAAAILAVWLAHPDKIVALRDASEHPFFGRIYMTFADNLSTWFLEYSSSPVIGALLIVSIFGAWAYRRKPGIRAVWIFAVFGLAFLIFRGRFRYRYNIVEACAFPLLTAILLPAWIRAAAARMALWRPRVGAIALVAGMAGLAVGVYWLARPDGLLRAAGGLFVWAYRRSPRHLGLQMPADHYVDYIARLHGGLEDIERAILLIGLALCIVSVALLRKRAIAAALCVAIAVTWLPGAIRLYARAPELIDWEIGGTPALYGIFDFVEQNTPPRGDILLAGGFNQLANNSLRWYLLTHYGPRNFDDVHVWGATIGSITLLPGPRVSYWASRLAQAPTQELPAAIVIIEPTAKFVYNTDFDLDAAVYRRVLAARVIYRLAAQREFPEIGGLVEIYRVKEGAEAPPVSVATALGPPAPVGAHGWLGSEDPWRHYWNPLIYK